MGEEYKRDLEDICCNKDCSQLGQVIGSRCFNNSFDFRRSGTSSVMWPRYSMEGFINLLLALFARIPCSLICGTGYWASVQQQELLIGVCHFFNISGRFQAFQFQFNCFMNRKWQWVGEFFVFLVDVNL